MVLDPAKRRQRAYVLHALEDVRCPHGEPVTLVWHPHRADGWFHIEAHCEPGRREATEIAAEALRRFPSSTPG